jgi:hypothetical protein
MMFFLGLALYLLILAARRGDTLLAAASGVAAGLAAGCKTNGIIYFGLLALYPIVTTVRWSRAVVVCLTFVAAGTAVAAVWWARNWVLLGNPFFPVAIPVLADVMGWPSAPGVGPAVFITDYQWVRSRLEWLAYPWLEWHNINQNWKHSSGLGAFFAAVLPATLVLSGVRLASSERFQKREIGIFGGFVVLSTVAWWSMAHEPRYWIPTLLFFLPLSAVVLSQLDRHYRQLTQWILVGCIGLMLGLFLVREVIVFGDRIIYSGHHVRHRAFGYPKAVDSLPPGSVIVNVALRTWHYALAGETLNNRVVSAIAACRTLAGMRGWGESDCGTHLLKLEQAPLRAWRATHLFSEGEVRYESADGVRLRQVEALTHNPVNGMPLPAPRILYEIVYPS